MSSSGTAKGKKPFNPKMAEKIFEKLFEGLRETSPQAFRELKGVLVRWERSDNQAECFEKMQEILAPHPDITKTINDYLEQQTKFTVHPSANHKLEELFKYLRDNHEQYLNRALVTLKNTADELGGDDKVKSRFLEIFKDNEEIYNRARTILEDVGSKPKPKEQETKKQSAQLAYDDDDGRKYQPKPKPQNKRPPPPQLPQEEPRPGKAPYILNTGINPEEMLLMMKLDKRSPTFVKLLNLYELCIFSKNEVLSMLRDVTFDSEEEAEMMKEMVELRQNERRKAINLFKPLNDIDFTNSTRITPSYVEMPWSYPVACRSKTNAMRSILNDRWVSVPYGSQHSHFSIRSKNQFEEVVLKSEDERYQFDLYSNRLRKAIEILDIIISKPDLSDEQATKLINSVVCMGIIQTLYKNAGKDQKEELEVCMKSNRVETCTVIQTRMADQLEALSSIRAVHGLKIWHDIADKNYYKSLDRKSFELKKNEKEFIKQSYYDSELEDRLKQLKNKDYRMRYFDENLSLWRLLNTFEGVSRAERCESNSLLEIPQYDAEVIKNRALLPLLFMSFNDTPSREAVYSFLHYHVNSTLPSQAERIKVKKCASKIFEGILFTRLKIMSIKDGFTEDNIEDSLKMIHKSTDSTQIADTCLVENYFQSLVVDQQARAIQAELEIEDLRVGRINVKKEMNDEMGYLPLKGDNQTVVFMTPLIYGVIRGAYTLYQRMLKAREVLFEYRKTRDFSSVLGECKFKLFRVLLMQYIKAKQTSKYEDFVEQLFGSELSYLFFTMHKLVESLTKSIQACLSCQFSVKLLDLCLQPEMRHLIENQYLYLTMANKMSISSTNSDKIIRFHLDNRSMVASINYLTSCYRLIAEEGRDKLGTLRIQELQKKIEQFTTTPVPLPEEIAVACKKKNKRIDCIEQSNNAEFMCLDQSLRFYSKLSEEDYLSFVSKRSFIPKSIRKELKRRAKTEEYLLQQRLA